MKSLAQIQREVTRRIHADYAWHQRVHCPEVWPPISEAKKRAIRRAVERELDALPRQDSHDYQPPDWAVPLLAYLSVAD